MSAYLRVSGTRVKVTVDSGSGVSLITRATVQRIAARQQWQKVGHTALVSVDGSPVRLLGAVTLPVD